MACFLYSRAGIAEVIFAGLYMVAGCHIGGIEDDLRLWCPARAEGKAANRVSGVDIPNSTGWTMGKGGLGGDENITQKKEDSSDTSRGEAVVRAGPAERRVLAAAASVRVVSGENCGRARKFDASAQAEEDDGSHGSPPCFTVWTPFSICATINNEFLGCLEGLTEVASRRGDEQVVPKLKEFELPSRMDSLIFGLASPSSIFRISGSVELQETEWE
ncbi:hypothetical protein R3P38DRAFT_3343996 [Favolaschia claudopus]|uniref:Uncharacterized protein n=1 Tax=Favolaschia claudopus TaxID=2862362 RepID=A0AAW0DJT8_9AGAR